MTGRVTAPPTLTAFGLGHCFEYGQFDQLKARTEPDGARYQFVHDTALQLVKVINPQGLT